MHRRLKICFLLHYIINNWPLHAIDTRSSFTRVNHFCRESHCYRATKSINAMLLRSLYTLKHVTRCLHRYLGFTMHVTMSAVSANRYQKQLVSTQGSESPFSRRAKLRSSILEQTLSHRRWEAESFTLE